MSNKYYQNIDEHFEGILEECGINPPNELQEKILKRVKQGGDLMVVAPKNAGKTYGAILSLLIKNPESVEGSPRSLMITDSDSEAEQMAKLIENATRRKELMVELAINRGNLIQQRNLIYYGADMVLGTPKRTFDLYLKNGINMSQINLFIMDNPDIFLNDRLIGDMIRISEGLPKCQRVFLVQEITPRVQRIVDRFLLNPMKIIG